MNIEKVLAQIKLNPGNVRFSVLSRLCEYYFGRPRQSGTSHKVFKTPWIGDPRVNIK